MNRLVQGAGLALVAAGSAAAIEYGLIEVISTGPLSMDAVTECSPHMPTQGTTEVKELPDDCSDLTSIFSFELVVNNEGRDLTFTLPSREVFEQRATEFVQNDKYTDAYNQKVTALSAGTAMGLLTAVYCWLRARPRRKLPRSPIVTSTPA